MPRRKITPSPAPAPPPTASSSWVRSETGVDRNGTPLAAGDRVKILNGKNLPDWVFRCHVKSDRGEWLDVYGRNNNQSPKERSFPVDKVERLPEKHQRKP